MVAGKEKINRMRIGIDCRMWDESGIGRYLRNLVLNLAKMDRENSYFLFILRKNKDIRLLDNFIKVEVDFGWYGASEQIKFPKIIKSYNLDLMHFPHFNIPFLYKGKFVVTIHDLIHQHHSTNRSSTLNPVFYRIKKLGYSKVFQQALIKSQKIITPSNFVKDQLVKEWGVSADKIKVTYEGVDEGLLNFSTKSLGNPLRFNGPYLFYIGNAHPHKNLNKFINVFKKINQKYPHLKLVLSGKKNYFWERILKEIKGDDNVIYTDYVTDKDAVGLYKNALIFVMPSMEEGFGIPILEAMACGCPVTSSNAGSLKEVGGDAALYFNPKDESDMEEKIIKVLEDKKLRAELIKKGEKRVKDFSWEKTARQTLEVYKNA